MIEKQYSQNHFKFMLDVFLHKLGATFTAKFLLENHEKSDCGRIPIYVCKECGKCLGTEYTYRAHLRIHREDTKSFICSYCNKGWRSKCTEILFHSFRVGSDIIPFLFFLRRCTGNSLAISYWRETIRMQLLRQTVSFSCLMPLLIHC